MESEKGPIVTDAGPAATAHLVRRWALREGIGVLMVGVILFGAAGRLNWGMGWALLGVLAAWVAGTALVVIPRHPELLGERLKPQAGSKRWDMFILSAVGLLDMARYVVAGLDMRFGWTAGIGLPLQIGMAVPVALGHAMFVWAIGTNAFFASSVRIQSERQHRVVRGGPYAIVRHPAYLGSIVIQLAAPVMLGSLPALIPGVLSAAIFVVRTALEDRVLQAELAGYAEYARRVRWRLLPGVW